jgi:hypothetical protein
VINGAYTKTPGFIRCLMISARVAKIERTLRTKDEDIEDDEDHEDLEDRGH